MKKVVWKFFLKPSIESISMPIGAEVLSIQSQGDDVCLWALVDPKQALEKRKFVVLATGQEVLFTEWENVKYISTLQFPIEGLVFHAFEII